MRLSAIILLTIISLSANASKSHRTKKASKSDLKQIRSLINSKIEKELPQSDAIFNQPPAFVRNPNAIPYKDELSINNADDYFQGDVELSVKQASQLLEQLGDPSKKKRTKRKIGKEPIYKRWNKHRPISYDFDQSIPTATRKTIKQALHVWETYTCIRFQEGGTDTDRLEFYDGGGCSSFVGRTGGTQGISITTPGCDTTGIISHEVGHSLGIFHEQARPDQQENIIVHYNNIPISRWNNFYAVAENQAQTFRLPYDAGSVMHYGAYGFATNPYHPTISTIDKNWRTTLGQRGGPSFLDIQAINLAYKCGDKCVKKLKCQNNGYSNPNDCSRCLCPMGLSGVHCELVTYSTCGAKIQVTTDRIVIESPFYPQVFPYNTDCYWLIQAPTGGKVYLEFLDQFDYECSEPCDSSYVEVKVKKDLRPVGYRFCCSNRPEQTFVSEGSQLIVMHRSLGALGHGFRAKMWSNVNSTILTSKPIFTTTQLPLTTTQQTTTTEDPEESFVFVTLPGEIPQTTSSKSDIDSNEIEPVDSIQTTESIQTTTPNWIQPFTFFPTLATLLPTFPIGTTTTESPLQSTEPSPEECMCGPWSDWIGDCSQNCGGCGRHTRSRACRAENCRKEEKRACNFAACPTNTNFLINNGEFHILINGCCVGLFESNGQCTGLDSKSDPFLNFIYKLLRPEDTKNGTRRISIPD